MMSDECCKEKIIKFCPSLIFRILITHFLKKKNDKLTLNFLKTNDFLKVKRN